MPSSASLKVPFATFLGTASWEYLSAGLRPLTRKYQDLVWTTARSGSNARITDVVSRDVEVLSENSLISLGQKEILRRDLPQVNVLLVITASAVEG
jgi:hypothetical protein